MQLLCKALLEQVIFLHTLLTVFLHIRNSHYMPSGQRTMYTEALRGRRLTRSLLNGHPTRIKNFTRVKQETFKALLQDSRDVSAAEKLLMFLFIMVLSTALFQSFSSIQQEL